MSGGGEVQQARTDLLARRFLPRVLRVQRLVPCRARITATGPQQHVRNCACESVCLAVGQPESLQGHNARDDDGVIIIARRIVIVLSHLRVRGA